MFTKASRPIRLILIILVAGLGLAATAQAEPPSECGPWKLFPDFRCDDRDARPDDAFNPVGMPYLFEDPHITTGLNFAYIYHRLPDDVFDGGGIHDLALQIRVAITDRIAFIATKDGLAILRPGDSAGDDTGILDMTMGFKGSLIDSREHNFILSPAIQYEIPLGSDELFQGNGKGVFIPSASFRWGLGEFGLSGANIVGSLGGQIPVKGGKNVQSLFYNIHLDYGIKVDDSFVKYVVPFIELNGIHYTKNGNNSLGIPFAFEGNDLANLGSGAVAGKDVLIMGGGIRLPTTSGVSFAVAYEGPVTSTKYIHNQRFTFMATWEM